ncbi:MAG TPA: queuosine precursor transporter [Methanoregulaceae archaeon]|nr:queuosine precursor transporter [Methanoregulaceae archaeon]
MLVWVYWIISLTLVTYLSVRIVRRYPKHAFAALTGFYIIYLGASQVLAARIVSFDLYFTVIFAPASVFIYPFIAQVIDMINEVYGETMTHAAILIAFVTQVLLVIFILMVSSLTPAPYFAYETAWQAIFAQAIRITAASWVAFLICANLDAYVFAHLKQRFLAREKAFSHGTMLNPYVWLRSAASDAVNLTLDSVIFVTLAFAGVMPLLPLIIGQVVAKNIIGFLDNPWFVWYKAMLNRDAARASSKPSDGKNEC